MLTEKQVESLGFRMTKSYDHDQFHTKRFEKYGLLVELTYEGENLISSDCDLSEVDLVTLDFEDLKALTSIIERAKQRSYSEAISLTT